MPAITTDTGVVTLINTFTSTPEQREQVVQVIDTHPDAGPAASTPGGRATPGCR